MQSRKLSDVGGVRTYAVILETGEEAMDVLKAFARTEGLDSAQFTAIGAFSETTLAFLEWESREYIDIPVNEQVEVASFLGDIVLDEDGKPMVHAHAVLGRRDGSTRAGHMKRGLVRPTLEVMITETPGTLKKRLDPASGLPLIRMD